MSESMNWNEKMDPRPPQYPQRPTQPNYPQWPPIRPQQPIRPPETPNRVPTRPPEVPNRIPARPPEVPNRTQARPPEPPRRATAGQYFRTTVMCSIITAAFCTFLVVFQVLFLITPDKDVSENENRMLQKYPKLSISSLADGSYMKTFETYLTDQFPGRDGFVSFKSRMSELTGSRKQQNVYRAKNGALLEEQTPLDADLLADTLGAVNDFVQANPALNSAFLLSPNATCFYADELPYGVKQENQREILNNCAAQLKGVTWVNAAAALDRLLEEDVYDLFYLTDHHWTTRAAYACFKVLAAQWKLDAKGSGVFFPVTDSFSGTLASAYGDRVLHDTIEICIPKGSSGTYIVDYPSQGTKTGTLFDESKLNQKNQYEVFLGGNFDKVVITTTAETENVLLLLKDSYANCLIPMLTPYFSTIVVIDPRYYNGSLTDVLSEFDFTHLLFLYNLNTFLADTSLAPVLRTAAPASAAPAAPQEDAQPAEDAAAVTDPQ